MAGGKAIEIIKAPCIRVIGGLRSVVSFPVGRRCVARLPENIGKGLLP